MYAHFFAGSYDLIFGVQSRFISMSVRARLQVLCATVTICATLVNVQTPTGRQTHRQHF